MLTSITEVYRPLPWISKKDIVVDTAYRICDTGSGLGSCLGEHFLIPALQAIFEAAEAATRDAKEKSTYSRHGYGERLQAGVHDTCNAQTNIISMTASQNFANIEQSISGQWLTEDSYELKEGNQSLKVQSKACTQPFTFLL